MKTTKSRHVMPPCTAEQGPKPRAKLGVGVHQRATGFRVLHLGTWPGRSTTTCRRNHEGPMQSGLGSSQRGGLIHPQMLNWLWRCGMSPHRGEKEPELLWEIKQYWLEIARLTFTQSLDMVDNSVRETWWACLSPLGPVFIPADERVPTPAFR